MISLAIIAKDEVEAVKSIIEKYSKYFYEVCIACDMRLDEFDKLASDKVKIYHYKWINDFAHKRNFLAEKVSSEFYLRMDTDDEIENPNIIPELVNFMKDQNFDVFYVPYIYAKDENGNCVAKHWRETIIRKKDGVRWNKSIHENILLEDKDSARIVRDDRLKIIHNIDREHAISSFNRNLEYLLEEFKKDGEATDPRTIAYLGRMLMSKGEWEKATFFLEILINRSGWDDDKYFAWIQMAQCYQQLGRYDTALGCCFEALRINTQFPDAYLQAGALYLNKSDFTKAVDWIMPGLVRPEPDTCMVVDPSFYGHKARLNAALALLGKGDATMAIKYFNEAKKMAPKDPHVMDLEKMFVDAFETDQYVRSFAWIANYTQRVDRTLVGKLIDSMPNSLFKDERACAIRNNYAPLKVWGSDEIVIYCGQAWEDWSPISTYKGIGGSEEAVIYLSKEFVKLGYKVTVFNSCGEMAGIYDGVEYKPFFLFNKNDKYNVLISWRGWHFKNIIAKKKYVWLHDVPQDGQFTKNILSEIDKIIVLSQFHRSLLPDVPDEKILVSANGINSEDFKPSGVIRNPHRMIHTSSYDRGIQHLLLMWPEIRKEVPDAELHLFYGWNTFDEMVKAGIRDNKFKVAMTKLMAQEGVTDHGRVGHKQLIKEFQRSGIWVYPSHFEEISCISAMKAQACGCVPVTTDYAALSETVKAGIKVKGRCDEKSVQENFKENLIKTLKDVGSQEEIRKEVISQSDEFGWGNVAKQWLNDFNGVVAEEAQVEELIK